MKQGKCNSAVKAKKCYFIRWIPIVLFLILSAVTPILSQDFPLVYDSLTGAEMSELIDEFISDVQRDYLFPDLGEKIAKQIRADIKAGMYSTVSTTDDLTKLLGKTVLNITGDKHFKVESARARRLPDTTAPITRPRDFGANHGFRKVTVLPGNIGYIQLENFSASDEAIALASREMIKVKDCKALIYDLRDNSGGLGKMVAFLSNYLFEGGKLLYYFFDREGNQAAVYKTDTVFAGRFTANIPVYILTSEHTLSAAESFAFLLQQFDRATIVGDTTGGLAHPSSLYTAQRRIYYSIPVLRFVHPLTNSDWEGVGVIPDIVVDPDSALNVAISVAGKALNIQ